MIGSGQLEYILAVSVGFLMAWAVGANDVANAMASTVGSKTLTVRQAVIVAAIFEALGSLLASGQVTNMIRFGIVDIDIFQNSPDVFIIGMLAALMAASSWLLIATYYGWPVSTTHSIVGAVVGFGLIAAGIDNIKWYGLVSIALSWFVTPLLGMLVSLLIFLFIRDKIFSARKPLLRCQQYIPVFFASVIVLFLSVTVFQGLEPLGIYISLYSKSVILIICAVICYIFGREITARKIARIRKIEKKKDSQELEGLFGFLSVITAAAMAFAHGSNDVANAIGPVAAVVSTIKMQSLQSEQSAIPFWLVALGAGGIVLGLVMYGYKIMETVGSKITQLTPSRGFSAQFATSAIIVLSSGIGLPVSTTQTMVGAVLGIGFARGFRSLNLKVIRGIFLSWFITFPAGALFSMLYYMVLSKMLVGLWQPM